MYNHAYLFYGAIFFILLLLYYILFHPHYTKISSDPLWMKYFLKGGLSKETISKITHDDNTWYYKNISTCVGYGEEKERCPRYETVCAGQKYYGNLQDQTKEVIYAIFSGGEHPQCPLLYVGAD